MRQDFRLHEQLAEREMGRIGRRRRHHHFGKAGDLDAPLAVRIIADARAADFDVVLGRDDDFRVQVQAMVGTAKFRAPLGENHFVLLRFDQGWLIHGGPDGAVVEVAQVAEIAPVIARAVLAPARHGQVFPAAVAAARIAHHDVVAAIRQQLRFRHGAVGLREDAHRHGLLGRAAAQHRQLGRVRVKRAGLRRAFLQHQQGRLQQRIGLETALHRTVVQQVAESQKAHALVVHHERADDGAALPARQARGGEIDRFKEAVAAHVAGRLHALQVLARRFRLHHQTHHAGVWRHHQVVGQAPLQAQSRHAKGAVLVIQAGVDRVVAGFGNPPRHVALAAIVDLRLDDGVVGLVQQGVRIIRHHQQWHQILEHRAAPRQQHGLARHHAQLAAQREPVLLRQLALRDGDEAGQAHFGSQ